jgi:hypothetical protein
MTVSDLLEQPRNKSDNINKFVTSCCSKLADNLGQAVRTQLVDGLLQDVRLSRVYYCSKETPIYKPYGFQMPPCHQYLLYGVHIDYLKLTIVSLAT